ncbi:hypothetical protein [Cohnella panacarvi]|uniref:hypothetical protein n=1 Tax=Cohnella panacarvi TaxID=400776 RepID=UPI00047D4321|nr:hypothetical protein [Cohnella panacarvi]
MIGNWRINVGFGGFGALLTWLFSYASNPIGTTLVRGVYAFATFTAIAFVISLLLGQLLHPSEESGPAITDAQDESSEDRGSNLDLITPDEGDELAEMMKERWSDGKGEAQSTSFQPLEPKQLVSLDNPNPEEVVQAIRRLTDE